MQDQLLKKLENLEKKIDGFEIPAGYTIGGAGATLPIWADALTQWLQVGTSVVGFVVILLTAYMQIQKIKKK
jgi:hypothetical protein